ncbi:hypothetical protein ACF0H5_005298 [Mactra antiquata]
MTKGHFSSLKQSHKLNYVSILLTLYSVSSILVTIGFFTPSWYKSSVDQKCKLSVGLVSGECRYPYPDLGGRPKEVGYVLTVTFWLMFTAMCILFVSSMFLIFGIFFKFDKNEVFLTFMAIDFGVFYPAATILVHVASIYSMASFPDAIDSSLICCEIGGGIMLIVCLMMRGYAKLFSRIGYKQDTRVYRS